MSSAQPSGTPASRRRILFVSPHASTGGAERWMETIIEGLGPDWAAEIVVLEDGPFTRRLAARGHQVSVISTGRRGQDLLGSALALRRMIRRSGADLIHANGIKAVLVCGLAALGTGLEVLWLKVDLAGDGSWLSRLAAALSDRIVPISQTAGDCFHGGAARKVTVVHCGIEDFAVERPPARERALALTGAGEESELILLVGRLCVGKGQLELIEVLPRVLAARPHAHCILLGDDDPAFPGLREELKQRASSLGILDSISFLTEPVRTKEILAGCDVVVAPSLRDPKYGWSEGFGLVVAEAMWAGVPVIAYRNGSLPEVLGDCGVLVDEGDRAALGEELSALLADPERRASLAHAGAQRARSQFGLERALAGMRRVYEQAADAGRGAAGRGSAAEGRSVA